MRNELDEFLKWWLQSRQFCPPTDASARESNFSGVVLFRHGQYQVQLFLMDPNTYVADHTHPCVDSYEAYLSGDFVFRLDGEAIKESDISDIGAPFGFPICVSVPCTKSHGASIGPSGAAFLSIQKWADGTTPTSVEHDWAFVGTDIIKVRGFVSS